MNSDTLFNILVKKKKKKKAGQKKYQKTKHTKRKRENTEPQNIIC